MADDGDDYFAVPEPDITFDLGRLPPDGPPSPPPTDGPGSESPSPGPSPPPTRGATGEPAGPAGSDPPPSAAPTLGPPVDGDDGPPTGDGRTSYWSCPPPPPAVVSGVASDGTAVDVVLPSGVSTAVIEYGIEVTLPPAGDGGDEDGSRLSGALASIERRVGERVASAMAGDGGGDDGDGGDCEGFAVDFRRLARKRRPPRGPGGRGGGAADFTETETVPTTRIIGIASGPSDFSADPSGSCRTPRDGCHPATASLEATYVGTNEAGVRSAVSRAVREELSDSGNGFEYGVEFVGTADGGAGRAHHPPGGGNLFDRLVGQWQEALPEPTEDSTMTPVGISMAAGLGAAFVAACYVAFVRSDRGRKARRDRRTRREKRLAKRAPLGDGDGEVRTHTGAGSDSEGDGDGPHGTGYCYDLGDVSVVDESAADCGDYDHGLEVAGRSDIEREDSADAGTSCGRTRKASNRSGRRDGGGTASPPLSPGSGSSEGGRRVLAELGAATGPGSDEETDGGGAPSYGPPDGEPRVGGGGGPVPPDRRRGGVLRGLFSRSAGSGAGGEAGRGEDPPPVDVAPDAPLSPSSLPSISEGDQLPPPANDTRPGGRRRDRGGDEVSEI